MSWRWVAMLSALLVMAGGAGWVGGQSATVMGNLRRDAQADQEMRIGLQRVLFRGDPTTDPTPGQLADEVSPWLLGARGGLEPLALGRTALEPVYRPNFSGELERLESDSNPTVTVFGHFDLLLVLTVLWPWMILFAPTPASWMRMGMWAAGPAGTVVAAAGAGLSWGEAGTWLRLTAWLAVAGLYGWVWLRLRDAIEDRVGDAWRVKSTVYVVLVVVLPAVATWVAGGVAGPTSRVEWAAKRYEASREPARQQAKVLSPYFERFPEFAPAEIRVEYDAARGKTAGAWRKAFDAVDEEQEASINRHRTVATALRILSPAALVQGAWSEIAGTGDSRATTLREESQRFARETWAPFFAKLKAGSVSPEILNRLPKFTPAATLNWVAAGWCVFGLAGWMFAGVIVRKR